MEDMDIKDDVAISVSHLTMKFNLNKEKVDNLKEYMIRLVKGKLEYKKFVALDDINFELKKGDRLAILGLNGAGKSTLLKTIVGVYKPTEGTVFKQGVIAPLLELGAGFDPNYSGRENIYLYGAILGYSREYLDGKIDEIINFSELGHFIEVPVKNYSSGMRARLGFSIATAVDPDILILDEVLSVGDAKFRKKSLAKVQSMFDHGVTVLFVSHNITQVKTICNKAILLEHGKIIAQGDVDDVASVYEEKTSKPKKKDSKQVVVPITDDEIKNDKKAAAREQEEIEREKAAAARIKELDEAEAAARRAENKNFLK
ncbi:MAG: ABC transporter ATP-binding protein [Eubacterium sp.]